MQQGRPGRTGRRATPCFPRIHPRRDCGAIANCNALGNAGDDPNGKFEFYPTDYLLVFVTVSAEPPNAEGKVAVLVEAVGRVPAGHVGWLTRQVVQLYRR